MYKESNRVEGLFILFARLFRSFSFYFSCRFERLKKKSKPTISLGLESGRYRRSVMPPITSGQANPSPVPSPPTSLTKGSHASDERRASIQSSGGFQNRIFFYLNQFENSSRREKTTTQIARNTCVD
jgi:hypothetical protein